MGSISPELRKAAGEDSSAGSGGEPPFGKCVTRRDGTPVDEGLVEEREPWWARGGMEGLALHCGEDGAWGGAPAWVVGNKMLPPPFVGFVGCHSQASCVLARSPLGDTHAHPPRHRCVCVCTQACVHVFAWACSFRAELSLKGCTKMNYVVAHDQGSGVAGKQRREGGFLLCKTFSFISKH